MGHGFIKGIDFPVIVKTRAGQTAWWDGQDGIEGTFLTDTAARRMQMADFIKAARADWPLVEIDGHDIDGNFIVRKSGVFTRSLFTEGSIPGIAGQRCPGRVAICRYNHDGQLIILGDSTPGYEPVDPTDMLRPYEHMLESGLIEFSSLLTFNGGQTVAAQFVIPGLREGEIIPGDPTSRYLSITGHNTGFRANSVALVNERQVCMNTWLAAHAAAKAMLKIGHYSNILKVQEIFAAAVDLANHEFAMQESTWREMLKIHPSQADFIRFVRCIFNPSAKLESLLTLQGTEGLEISSRDQVIPRLLELRETGKGTDIPGVRGSLYGDLQAVSEYVQHYRGNKETNESDRLFKVLYADGAALLQRTQKAADLILAGK